MLPKLNCVLKWILKKLSNFSSPSLACDFLDKLHFKQIARGSEAHVFARKGFDYVIKIVDTPHGQNGVEILQHTPPISHFAESLVVDAIGRFYIIVQKKLSTSAKKGKSKWDILERFERCLRKNKECVKNLNDITDLNLGFDNNRPVLIDWTAGLDPWRHDNT